MADERDRHLITLSALLNGSVVYKKMLLFEAAM